ncbi:hypothetical protein [Microbacterium sp. cx-59]|uniref:hypothetical protein n=1 Tax=Microbacterium sp. cx-59 TaxID=2891207 RepID=UPI001E2EAFD6|nr:hypothetical protein [Microbacterium sp. cx-59]MCC4908351.1 hypothetical protein [Microbacterium sp. cx-59]
MSRVSPPYSIDVVIPWRPAPSRLEPFQRVWDWYAANLPDARLRTIDTADDVFVLAACRNEAVRTAADDAVVVLSDADTLPEIEPLRRAIESARTSGLVHLPYTEYRWLGGVGTAQYASGTPLEACEYEQLVRGACSGVYVTTPSAWWAHGGQDEGFRGWGFEDAAWYLAHETLLGEPPRRHEGRVYAMHHAPETRAGAGYDANAARMERYRAVQGDPVAMRELLAVSAR